MVERFRSELGAIVDAGALRPRSPRGEMAQDPDHIVASKRPGRHRRQVLARLDVDDRQDRCGAA